MWPMAVASPQGEHRAMLDIHIILLYHLKEIIFPFRLLPAVRLARILTFVIGIILQPPPRGSGCFLLSINKLKYKDYEGIYANFR